MLYLLLCCLFHRLSISSQFSLKLINGERDNIIKDKTNEDKWIIDGNYNNTIRERFNKADLIIWLDYSTYMQLKGIFKRFLKEHNRERKEIPGCKERLKLNFVKYVATYNKKKRHIIEENLKEIPKEKVLIFRKQKDLNKWLKEFTKNENVLNEI